MGDVFNRDELARVKARIDSRIDSGVGAARYDGDPGTTGGSSDSHPERVALERTDPKAKPDPVSEKAVNDLHALQRHAVAIEEICADYPSVLPAVKGQLSMPGVTDCPKGRCRTHWDAGISTAAVKKPARSRCRRCHEFYKTHGEDYPPLVLQAVRDLGGPTGPQGSSVWNHPTVLRAWESSGWNTKPVLAKRSA